ncbi:MAG: nucleoid-associated protein [Alteromonadaceae bacterium]|jgi:nucleoid-associated protein
MSTQVLNLAINYIEQKEGGEVICRNRDDLLAVTDRITNFIEHLHFSYSSKSGKEFCSFTAEKNTAFSAHLASYLGKEEDFLSFANSSSQLLSDELKKYNFVESGYLLLCQYNYLATDYLLILMLNIKDHFSVTNELEIAKSRHLDLTSLQLAARIDLTEMAINRQSNRYISFVKGRAGRKVADFFLDFLGCEEGINAKQQSTEMLQAVEDFISLEQLDAEEKSAIRKNVYDYCNERSQLGQDAVVEEISSSMNLASETAFKEFQQNQGYKLEESFPVDKRTVNSLVKFAGQGGGVSLSFDKKLFGDSIFYDVGTDSLMIKGIPPNLKDQIERHIKGGSGS